ncbi:hypothetical protein EP227_05395 [bacterium]|nr:MAG: hypothetical protein EP227_05395 [bacterium]
MNKIVCRVYAIALLTLYVSSYGCSPSRHTYPKNTIDSYPPVQDFSLNEKVLSLNPEHLTEKDVDEVLSLFPAPRVININGSLPLVKMDSFSRFLIAMGYPEKSVRNPGNESYSYSSYRDSTGFAGMIAWYYEKEGLMPILIGHSQGGMMVIKILHELAGAFDKKLPLWNPQSGETENRYTIIDPLTGNERNVTGLKLGYASSIGAGRFMRFILGQWNMLGKLRQVPDSVEEFTGFYIKYDLIGSDLLGFGKANQYYPLGSASVRNVRLPASYIHITIPLTEHLAQDTETRRWINEYTPATEEPESPEWLQGDTRNILLAAEIWYNIKKFWCIEIQKLIQARKKNKRT